MGARIERCGGRRRVARRGPSDRRAARASPRADVAADIVVSDDPSVAVAIQTADCVPILLADRRTGAVAAAHAGWRGLAARAPAAAVAALSALGSRASDLVAAVGPAISGPRYEVGADVRAAFEAAGFGRDDLERWFAPGRRAAHWQFDGWASTSDQLAAAGVGPGRIFVAALCTAAHPRVFCSYRRDGAPAGRMAAVVRCGRLRP
jgi:purine-nucleoside/S-methyl-5'-thioadenosine phosphorylase / adenosine deaminase